MLKYLNEAGVEINKYMTIIGSDCSKSWPVGLKMDISKVAVGLVEEGFVKDYLILIVQLDLAIML